MVGGSMVVGLVVKIMVSDYVNAELTASKRFQGGESYAYSTIG